MRFVAPMGQRARSFGAVAAAYERYRLDYPDSVADVVLEYAGRPLLTALEIGAGTGKATRVFARRDIVVTATDPDAEMLAVLRHHVPDSTLVERLAFEELPLDHRYDLVFAAASLHWTVAEGRWERVASLLTAGGVLAAFGGMAHLEPALGEAVAAARSPYLVEDEIPSPDGTPYDAALQWPGTELVDSELFTDVRQVEVPRRLTVTAEWYLGHLSTISAYVLLPPAEREQAFAAIRDVLPETLDLTGDVTLHLARLAG